MVMIQKLRKLPVCATRADAEKNFRDSGEEQPFRDLLTVPLRVQTLGRHRSRHCTLRVQMAPGSI